MWKWTKKRQDAALALAQGFTVAEVANQFGIPERTLYRWKIEAEFAEEVDRLTLLTGIATKAERARIAKRVVMQKIKEDGTLDTDKDLLDWLKYTSQETEGVVLKLLASIEGGNDS